MRAWYCRAAGLEARHSAAGSGSPSSGALKGGELRSAAAREQDLDLLLRCLECRLAMAGERDAALEGFQRLIERQIAALQPRHQSLELRESLLEIRRFTRVAQ